MLEWIKNVMNSLGYAGIALLMFLENIFPPIPSELIMPFAGFITVQGQLLFWWVVLAGMLGSIVGQLPLYYVGKFIGAKRLKEWADRHGKWLTVSSREIEQANHWFEQYGRKAVFFCRLVPGIRSLISIPAGISGMNMGVFLLYTALGTGLWTGLLAYLGRLLGENYEQVNTYLGPVAYIVLGIIVLAGITWLIKRKKRKRADRQASPSE